MKTISIFLLVLFSSLAFNFPQERSITGKVTSADDGTDLPGVNVLLKGTSNGTSTDHFGKYTLIVPASGGTLVFSFIGYQTKEIRMGIQNILNVQLGADVQRLDERVVMGYSKQKRDRREGNAKIPRSYSYMAPPAASPEVNTEEYEGLEENIFHGAMKKPLSTFSIDVDAASYSNLRRFINNGEHPPKEAVRLEEMINYFDYDYREPQGQDPFNVYTEISEAPWNMKHKVIHIGLTERMQEIWVRAIPSPLYTKLFQWE